MKGDAIKLDAWERLRSGGSLGDLQLKLKDGRLDLSGLELTPPAEVRQYKLERAQVVEFERGLMIRGAKWRDLDFTGGRLEGLRLFECEIANCRFDRCRLQGMRLWASTISGTSFRNADLRKGALGGVDQGRRNCFLDVDFTDANLGQTMYTAAAFQSCLFRNSKLEKIDFQTSTFSDCKFEGELREVLFYRRAFNGEQFPPNEMDGVDFTRAKFRHVEFRGLTLDRALLPDDSELVIFQDFSSALDKLIGGLQPGGDLTDRKLLAFLGVHKKWAAPGRGVISLGDIADIVGAEGLRRFRELVAR
jgi:uncharacterized protein YjbI with pentapeptide repeats